MRGLRLFLFGLAFVYPIYWTAQFVVFALPDLLRAVIFGQRLTLLDISFLQATAVAQTGEAIYVRAVSLLAALLCAGVIHLFQGQRFLTGSMGVAVLGQCALLPYLQFMPNGGGPVVLAALGAVMAFALLCIGVYELGMNARGLGFIERLGTVVMLLLLPQTVMWLAFRLKYPNFGWRFLAMMLVPLLAGVVLGEALPARVPKGEYVPPPTLEIIVGFAITALFLIGIAVSGSASASSNLAWPDLPALREVAENANFTAS